MKVPFLRRAQPERKSMLEDWPWETPIPESLLVLGGTPISIDTAVGLPALLACFYRIGEGIGLMPQIVYEGRSNRRQSRERAAGSWQWALLHDRPNSEVGPAAFRADLAISVAGHGKAFARKFKARGRVTELIPLDARKVKVRRSGGRLVFDDSTAGGQPVTRDQREIIYIRGPALNGSVEPVSRITACRQAIHTGLSRLAFEQRFFSKNARPGTVLAFPEEIDHEKAKLWLELWDQRHQGLEHSWETSAIGGGATVTTLPVSFEDAQFVQAMQLTIEQVAGLYGIPKRFVSPSDAAQASTHEERWQLVTFGLGPIYTAIDQAFNADLDLFPAADDRFCEHLADALLKPDTKTRYEAYKAARQAGWLTANEIRALENYPPVDGGDELQQTPVGGAPNSDEADKALGVIVQLFKASANGSAAERRLLVKALERAREQGFELDDETALLVDLDDVV